MRFAVDQGRNKSYFLQEPRVAVHLLLATGSRPRAVFAFPAGNAGIGLWMDRGRLALEGELEVIERDGLRGVRARLSCDRRAVDVTALLGSIRALRGYGGPPDAPPADLVATATPGQPLVLRRSGQDGRRFELVIAVAGGRAELRDGRIALSGAAPLRLSVEALTDNPPLTPLPVGELLRDPAAADPRLRDALGFLTYREKMLAGSWRFLTYFGRDTLMTVRLLMPALTPAAIESGLGAVIDRMSLDGQVAHEESIGEWPALERSRGGAGHPLDYAMVDDDFMLAPVLAAYLATPAGQARATSFLARVAPGRRRYRDAVAANLRFVLAAAEPYARSARPTDLIRIRDGIAVGDWRDSNEGLAGGRYAYSINVALVPAALAAAAALADGPLADAALAARARRLARRWGEVARAFDVVVPIERARAAAAAEARAVGLEVPARIETALRFPAIALDAAGRPIPVMHSDDGFVLLFGQPDGATLLATAARISQPYPLGLHTPLGMLVANGSYLEDPALRRTFDREHYHGAVVWSWQQAMMAAGVDRQLGRTDLSPDVRAALLAAEARLWDAIDATRKTSAAELWSWRVDRARFSVAPLGSVSVDDEANAVQLWSTVFLAIQRPDRAPTSHLPR